MEIPQGLLKPDTLELREYQMKILEEILNKNSLVILPTGMGKTYLAIMVACCRLNKFPDSKILVMAPTRPLTVQHYNTFRRCMNLPQEYFRFLTGEIDGSQRGRIWEEGKIFFATPQVVERDLLVGKVKLADFSLLVFDEAHRAVGDYPYVFIASEYMKCAKNPMILALTASPGGEKERIEEVKRNLFIECIKIRTEKDRDVRPYVKPVKIEWRRVQLPEYFLTLKKLLEELLNEWLQTLKSLGYLESPEDVTKRKLLELQQKLLEEKSQGVDVSQALLAQAIAMKILHALELLETQGVYVLRNFLSRIVEKSQHPGGAKADKILARDRRIETVLSLIKRAEETDFPDHPKLEECLNVVKEQLARDPSSRILIFTNYRDTAEKLIALFSKNNIRVGKLLGQAKREGKEGMTQREQLKTLQDFRDRKLNVLVCTSVGEEGLDVPDVELVVFYEAIPSEIRAIQRRGRTGRTRPGRVIVLLGKGTRDEAYYWSAVRREREMMKLVEETRQKKLGEF